MFPPGRRSHQRESEIHESPDVCGASIDLITPMTAGTRAISLATIFVEPGAASTPHFHKVTEEIYYFIEGEGKVTCGGETFKVGPGSAVYIPVGEVHWVENTSAKRLKFVSADSPTFDLSDIFPPEEAK